MALPILVSMIFWAVPLLAVFTVLYLLVIISRDVTRIANALERAADAQPTTTDRRP